jgi:16S rRNA (cytidine1402-2'-O)-methyltransferase
LTNKREELGAEITRMEDRARQFKQTQIFIETPYRNRAMLDALVKHLSPRATLCIAYDITGKEEQISSRPITTWRKQTLPTLAKKPCIFLVSAL